MSDWEEDQNEIDEVKAANEEAPTKQEMKELIVRLRKSSRHLKSLEAFHHRLFKALCKEAGVEMDAIIEFFQEHRDNLFAPEGEFMNNPKNFRRKKDGGDLVLSAAGEENRKKHDEEAADKAVNQILMVQLKAFFNPQYGEEKEGINSEATSSEAAAEAAAHDEKAHDEDNKSQSAEVADGQDSPNEESNDEEDDETHADPVQQGEGANPVKVKKDKKKKHVSDAANESKRSERRSRKKKPE